MNRRIFSLLIASFALILLGATKPAAGQKSAPKTKLSPATMPRVATIDERFQSYNIEMVEVTGGRFWKPYASLAKTAPAVSGNPADAEQARFQYRKPIDLTNPRLRKLAAALGPAYLRVSGTWANSAYFQNSDKLPPPNPPKGFNGTLTRHEWKGVVDFSQAVDAKLVTSFAISAGTRNAAGVWTPNQAQQLIDYTHSIGGHIAAAALMNEPNIAMDGSGGAPANYSPADFGRDEAVFVPFARKAAPDMVILGPGGAAETTPATIAAIPALATFDLMKATGPVFDVFTYHFYGAVSSRCSDYGASAGTTLDAALSDEWLGKTAIVEQFYNRLRNQFEPGKPMWLTETAQAACGGSWWASTFVDSFRYLNQLGALAKSGVKATMHNTLAASDYALLDPDTYTPRPNYWSAFLWRNFMGTTVLDPGPSPDQHLRLFAHCLRNHPGGVALLALNTSKTNTQVIHVSTASQRYSLTARKLTDGVVLLNGSELKLGAEDALPALHGSVTPAGEITFAPASITFLAFPHAGNASCQK